LTAEEALRHRFVQQFASPDEEIVCQNIIDIPMDDNHKFTIKEYRDAIYADITKKRKEKIQKQYAEKLGTGTEKPEQQKKSSQQPTYTNQNSQNTNSSLVSNNQQQYTTSTQQSTTLHHRSHSGYTQKPTPTENRQEDKDKILQEKKQNYGSNKSGSFYSTATSQSSPYQKVTKQNSMGGTPSTNVNNTSVTNTSVTNTSTTSSTKGSTITNAYGNYYYQNNYQATNNVGGRPSSQGYMGSYGKVNTSATGSSVLKKK